MSDLESILAINRASALAAYGHIFGATPFPTDRVRERYRRLLAEATCHVFLAEEDGTPVGFVAARRGRVEVLYVAPDSWGCGVGSCLYERAEPVLGSEASLRVLEANARGREFWRRRGWHPDGETKVENGQVEVRYRRLRNSDWAAPDRADRARVVPRVTSTDATRASLLGKPGRWQAVIFDLWDTLVEFPWDTIAERDAAMADELAVDADELRSTWLRLEPEWETSPLMPSLELLCRELGVHDFDLEKLCSLRLEYMRQALQPRAEVIETLCELRRRGLRLGLITACSGDVPMVWSKTPLAGLFDTTIFSCEVGLCKPDVRIYRRATAGLHVPPGRCLYVGDGGHDELAGAARAGMTAVLLRSERTSTRPDPPGWTHEIDTILAALSLA